MNDKFGCVFEQPTYVYSAIGQVLNISPLLMNDDVLVKCHCVN